MAYSDVISRGAGTIEYFVQIEGIKYVLATTTTAPTDAWYTGEGFSVLSGLKPASIQRYCRVRKTQVWPEMNGFDLLFDDDADETLSQYLKSQKGLTKIELNSDCDAGDTTITVVSTSAYDAAGVIHIDREAIYHSGKTATAFTGCTRGYHGSVDADHLLATDVYPPCIPWVLDGPGGVRGRRVVIYAAEVVNDTMSATTQIFVGYIDGSHSRQGHTISIPCSPALKGYLNGSVMGGQSIGRVRGLYIPNYEGMRWGRLAVDDVNHWQPQVTDVVTEDTVAFYDTVDDLIQDTITAVNSDLTDWVAGTLPDGRFYMRYEGSDPGAPYDGNWVSSVRQDIGQLAMILGYDPLEFPHTHMVDDPSNINDPIVANRLPADVFFPLDGGMYGLVLRLYLNTGEASLFVESMVVLTDPVSGLEWNLDITNVDTTNDILNFEIHPIGGSALGDYFAAHGVGGGQSPYIKQAIAFNSIQIHQAMRLLWDATNYTGATLEYTIEDRWLPEPCLQDGDVDWDTLERLVQSSPAVAGRLYMVVDKPMQIRSLFTGHLMACGIYAFIKEDGTVGWARIAPQTKVGVTTTITSADIDGVRCTDITTDAARDRVVNSATFKLQGREGRAPITVIVVDTMSLQKYGSRPFHVKKEDQIIELSCHPTYVAYAATSAYELSNHMASILAYLGEEVPGAMVPVTIGVRDLEIGDLALITSVWVEDHLLGTMGVSGKLVEVVGWSRIEGFGNDIDMLDLEIIDQPAGGIAPSALASSWDSGSKTLTFSNKTLFCSENDTTDLDYFEAGDYVTIEEWDASSPSTWTAIIDSVSPSGGTMVLTTAPGGLTAPCVVRFRPWASATADQQGEGWAWVGTNGVLSDSTDGTRWS